LHDREIEILRLVAEGCSNKEAAKRLFLSEAAVKTHLLRLYAKLGVKDRAAAVAAGFRKGPLQVDERLPAPSRSRIPIVRTRSDAAISRSNGRGRRPAR